MSIVYPKTENRNRKPVCGLSKTENPVLTAVPGFAKPGTAVLQNPTPDEIKLMFDD